MEATRKIRASKSKKKGGNGTQVISAADEARKREAIKEALRQKLELERKALQVVERLLEDTVTEEFLIDCAWHITPANYKDTVEERSIAKLCGYPRCPNKLTNIPTQQFKISTKTNRVYDITERKCFCSNFCYRASKCFELQISKTPLWLRKEERPPEVKLMKEGEGGSSGQEIKLVDKPVTEADIDNPVPDVPESHKDSPPFNQSDNSDIEQDFVTSVVSRQHKHARVHWGKLSKRDGVSEDRLSAENKQYAHPEPTQTLDGENNDESGSSKTSQPQTDPTACLSIPNKTISAGSDVEGTLELLNQCSLKDTAAQQETNLPSQPEIGNSTPPASGLNVTQEVEELDEDDVDEAEVEVSLRQNSGSSSSPSDSAPDFETLWKETELLELRVREFYKGVYVLPEEVKTDAIKDTRDKQDSGKDPPLPLVDSHAQHLIQKRIAVEKLSQSLRDIVGPLRLTMSDVINDINNLVRTFRFTNTNIIHKRPEWTLIAVVLLSALTEVSPLLRESLASPSSLEYISSRMSELKLEDKDLHNLVKLFKACYSTNIMYHTHI